METGLREEDLVGAWMLGRWSIEWSEDGRSSFPFGENATGLLLYLPGGFMSAGISRAGRPGFDGGNVRNASQSVRAEAFDGYFHYQGRFRITGRVVEHHVTHSLNPDFVGTVQRREALLQGGQLELRAEDQTNGTRRLHRLVWHRMEP